MMIDEKPDSAILVFDRPTFWTVRIFLVQPFVNGLPIVSAKNNSLFDESELPNICSFAFSCFFSFFGLLPLYPIHSLLQSGKTRCHGQLAVVPCFWIPFVLVILTHDNSRLRSFGATPTQDQSCALASVSCLPFCPCSFFFFS